MSNSTLITAVTKIDIVAPNINSNGDWHHTGTITASVDVISNGKSGHNHVHSDPQGGNTGAPV